MLRVYLVLACSEATFQCAVILFSWLSARCYLSAARSPPWGNCAEPPPGPERGLENIPHKYLLGFETGWETLPLHTECLPSANIHVQVLIDAAAMGAGVPYIRVKARRVILLQSSRGVEAAPCVLSDQALLSTPHLMGTCTC